MLFNVLTNKLTSIGSEWRELNSKVSRKLSLVVNLLLQDDQHTSVNLPKFWLSKINKNIGMA